MPILTRASCGRMGFWHSLRRNLRQSRHFFACYHSFVPISDTTPEAQAVQLAIHRAMTGEQRLLLAFEMCEFARQLNRARLRDEHPEWSEKQIARELLRLAFLPSPLPVGLR